MATVTNDVSQAGRTFIGRHTGIFSDSTQETNVKKVSLDVSTVSNISWSVNSTGYITLSWEGTPNTVFAVISGNGRWELGKGAFKKPATATGNLLVSTVGFAASDTYTLILQGSLV